ncbi:unnamed protein product, partial [Ectocarpus sp. 12 AP-2014]
GEAAAAADPAVPDSLQAGDPNGHPLDQGGCFVCKKNDKQDLILLCDGCEGEYHTFCVDPPLRKIPDDEWFCEHCKATGKAGPKESKYTGVYWSGTTRIGGILTAVWTAKIRRRSGRREAIIGSYHSEKEAAGAYDAEAKRVFGDTHPVLNFPNGSWEDEPDEPEEPSQSQKTEEKKPQQPKQPQPVTQQPKQPRPVAQQLKQPEQQSKQPEQPREVEQPAKQQPAKQQQAEQPVVVAPPPPVETR